MTRVGGVRFSCSILQVTCVVDSIKLYRISVADRIWCQQSTARSHLQRLPRLPQGAIKALLTSITAIKALLKLY